MFGSAAAGQPSLHTLPWDTPESPVLYAAAAVLGAGLQAAMESGQGQPPRATVLWPLEPDRSDSPRQMLPSRAAASCMPGPQLWAHTVLHRPLLMALTLGSASCCFLTQQKKQSMMPHQPRCARDKQPPPDHMAWTSSWPSNVVLASTPAAFQKPSRSMHCRQWLLLHPLVHSPLTLLLASATILLMRPTLTT